MVFVSWRVFFFFGLQSSNLYEKTTKRKKTGGAKSITFPQKAAMEHHKMEGLFQLPAVLGYLPLGGVGEFSSQAALQGEDPKCGKGKPQDAVRREEDKMASATISHTRQRQSPGSPTMKGIPSKSLLVKVARGVFQFGVLKQP